MATTETWQRVEISTRDVPSGKAPIAPGPGVPAGVLLSTAAAVALVVAMRVPGWIGIRATTGAVAFVALVAQALPFLLVGAVVASFFQGSSGRRVLAAATSRPRLAAALAPLSGAALPLCDCGLVPLARQIRSSTGRRSIVNGFVAGAPLTNPVVIVSTVLAFPGSPGMVVGRVAIGICVAMLVASLAAPPGEVSCHEPAADAAAPSRAFDALGAELARTAPTLVLASLAAGVVKGFIPGSVFAALGTQPLLGAVAMMGLAFVLSICSSADAFVAASIPVGALPRLAFLVLGPMLDLRLAAMYRREFGTRWLLSYSAVVVPSVLVLVTAWATWGPT